MSLKSLDPIKAEHGVKALQQMLEKRELWLEIEENLAAGELALACRGLAAYSKKSLTPEEKRKVDLLREQKFSDGSTYHQCQGQPPRTRDLHLSIPDFISIKLS